MDVICRVDHEALDALGYAPGSMNLVDHAQQEAILAVCAQTKLLAGGSCANTVRAIAFLAASADRKPTYTGGVGSDDTGRAFGALLEAEGVRSRLGFKETPTGRSVILVTPDGQRTMFTYLGACREMTANDVDVELFREAGIFHTTGYMWDTDGQEAATQWAMTEAKENGATVSFDIADPFVVARFRDKLIDWLPGHTDLLFANEEELSALVGIDGPEERVVEEAFAFAPTVIMKAGKRGAYLGADGRVTLIPGTPVDAQDTTGAGDSFAGGYLYGIAQGLDRESSVELANAIASRVVTVDGCDYDRLKRSTIVGN
jgi:sugar/nucleoside kinase (ribokinase family)